MSSTVRFDPAGPLRGSYTPPADKSISHRAALFGAMADEPVTVINYLDSEDTRSTLDAVMSLGAGVEQEREDCLLIRGIGLHAPLEATGGLLNVGNAGTLMRLLPGWLAGQPGGVGRSTGTLRSASVPSTGSRSRSAGWARAWTHATTASRPSRSAGRS